MNFIMITLKINMATNKYYCLHILIVQCIKLKLKLSKTILAAIRTCVILKMCNKINKISLSCFDEKIHIQNNGYDGLALHYQN